MIARTMLLVLAAALLIWGAAGTASAEDGYDVWLRYRPLPAPARERVDRTLRALQLPPTVSPTVAAAAAEFDRAMTGMTGTALPRTTGDGAILIGTPLASPRIAALRLDLRGLGAEGYRIRSVAGRGARVTVIAANTDLGVLYGSFALIARIQRGEALDGLDIVSAPTLQRRVLDHWDNLDGSVERGYAGQSLWDWWTLPGYRDPRYTDYARANASIGINGAVLNNVNAVADSLTAPYIAKAAALADMFRPYGIRVYLSVRFSAPIELGGLKTADPLDPAVAAWWKAKADEIYAAIPDFGGFLVKANSEGQPGPQDYRRSHAEGANMLAAAVRPHGGIVMWRAFVYAHDDPEDRAKQAYAEFQPLDGTFADNVIVQVKNGAIDFQPREPFHPLFGAMPKTPLMLEVQVTKEYLGFATHLAYLGTLFEETLRSDTQRPRRGSTVARVLARPGLSGMAGVANIGRDRDWSGSTFNQANWFAFGRMAWNPDASARDVARDWSERTFGIDPAVTGPIVGMMMASREAVVDYMTPLGLAHLMATGHHYGPAPWVKDLARPEWNPVYYHKADTTGIGINRTATGSNALAQYAPGVAAILADVATVPEDRLLWFHHVGWDHRMASGRTLWEELVDRYTRGVRAVAAMRATWEGLRGRIDDARFAKTAGFLEVQQVEAQWWRDACIAYFANVSGRPIPPGYAPPAHPLSHYEAIDVRFVPGQ